MAALCGARIAMGISVYLDTLPCLQALVMHLGEPTWANLLSDQELAQEFLELGSWEGRFEKLRKLILERGAPDNFTALCCILE